MKCPVCDKIHTSMVCPKCGFDSSRDYGRYPTFGVVGKVPSASGLREQWRENPTPPEPEKQPRKGRIWLVAAACALAMGLGIWIGTGMGRGKTEPTEKGESVQMRGPTETAAPTETMKPPNMTEAPTNLNDIRKPFGEGQVINSSVDKTVDINVQENEYIGIKEFAWFTDYEYLSCIITITNKNDECAVEFPAFRITAYDSSGMVLGTSEQTLSIIHPENDFTNYCLLFELTQKPDRIDIVLLEPEEYCIIHKSMLTVKEFEQLIGKNVVVYVDSVKGEIYNPNNYSIDGAMVTAIFRDDNGDIVFGEQTFVNQLPATGTVPFDMYVFSDSDLPSECEIVAVPW